MNDGVSNLWTAPDLLVNYEREPKGIPVGRAPTVNLRNNHTQYIFTWYVPVPLPIHPADANTTKVRPEPRYIRHVLDGRQEAHIWHAKTRPPQRRLVISHPPSFLPFIFFPNRIHAFPLLPPELRHRLHAQLLHQLSGQHLLRQGEICTTICNLARPGAASVYCVNLRRVARYVYG